MQQRTKDHLNGNGSPNLHAYCAFRAIMRAVGRTGLPQAFHTDLAIDADILYRHTKPIRFTFCLRACGTNIVWPGEIERLQAEQDVFGQQCHWFTYDEDRLDRLEDEPELITCSFEEARGFLIETAARRDEARYLTPPELRAVADRLQSEAVNDKPEDTWECATCAQECEGSPACSSGDVYVCGSCADEASSELSD